MPTNSIAFFKDSGENLMIIAAKVVHDLKVADTRENVEILIDLFNRKFKLETVASGFSMLRFLRINKIRKNDMPVGTDRNYKLDFLIKCSSTFNQRKQSDALLYDLERAGFELIDTSLGWIESPAFPF